jgi:hypothetical protein
VIAQNDLGSNVFGVIAWSHLGSVDSTDPEERFIAEEMKHASSSDRR